VLNPWDGAFIDVMGPAPLKFSMVGEAVPPVCHQVVGAYHLSMISIPFGGKLSQAVLPIWFWFADGDTVFVFDCDSKSYKEPYQYIGGFGWFSNNPDDPGPDGPTLAIGQSIWFWGGGPLRRPCVIEDPIAASPATTGPRLTDPERTGTSFNFKFLAEDSATYQAQVASSYTGPWQNILAPLTGPAGGGMLTVTHINAGSFGIYRLAKQQLSPAE